MRGVVGGVDPGEIVFRPRFVGVSGIRTDFWNGDGALLSSCASERPLPPWLFISSPGVAIALRAEQPLNDKPKCEEGFNTIRCCVVPGELGFRL